MKAEFKIGIVLAVLPIFLAACGGIKDPTPRQLVVENHWGGNTDGSGSGTVSGGNAISNFVVDIAVLKKSDLESWGHPEWAPMAVTQSYWDETDEGDGAYSAGQRVSKGQYFYQSHDDTHWPGMTFDTTTSNGTTVTIERPQVLDTNHNPQTETLTDQQIKDIRQQNAEDQGLPLTDFADNRPFVKLSGGRTITSVAYPTGVAFDNSGRLWVADNGPDQNFKIFNVPATGAPTPATPSTFGDVGGVFAAGNGKLKGQTGEKRFWGPRGVGFGDDGEIIVGTSGIPGQVQGGTDVRAFDSTGKALWDVKSIFMHSPDIDPSSSGGTQIYTAAQRFEMNYNLKPGKSWKQAAVTLDPFRFPGDPRLFQAYGVAFVRVINGQKFLFASEMYGYDLAIFRFEANSEIAIPAAFIGIGGNQQGAAWTQGKAPVWTGTWDENKNRRLMWRDTNGNGVVDAGEFSDVQMPHVFSRGFDIDDNGNVWVAGKFNEHNDGYREGGNLVIPFGSIDGKGVPFLGSVPRFVDVPSSLIDAADVGATSGRMRYLAATDTTIMATGKNEDYYSGQIYVLDGLATGHPTRRFKLNLGYDTKGSTEADILRADPILRDLMVLPCVFAADADYLYVGYMQNGLDAPVRGEITVYSMVDGHKVGWMVPGAETNHFAGNFDMKMGIQVRKLGDGTRIIVAEENGAGKFMVYRWKP